LAGRMRFGTERLLSCPPLPEDMGHPIHPLRRRGMEAWGSVGFGTSRGLKPAARGGGEGWRGVRSDGRFGRMDGLVWKCGEGF